MKLVEKLCITFPYRSTSHESFEIAIVLHKLYQNWKGVCDSGGRASDSRLSHQRQRTTWARSVLVCCFLEQAFRTWVSFLILPSEWDCYSWPFHCRIPDKFYVVGRQERRALRVRLILNILKKSTEQGDDKCSSLSTRLCCSLKYSCSTSHFCMLHQLLLPRHYHIQPWAKRCIVKVCICISVARSSTLKILVNQR